MLSPKEFLAARKDVIGGSDMTNLLNQEPFGCLRALQLSRLDFVDMVKESFHLERGNALEEVAVKLFEAKMRIKTKRVKPKQIKGTPIKASADRVAYQGKALVEVKCPSGKAFKEIKKYGVPQNYMDQMNYTGFAYGLKEAYFVAYWSEQHELFIEHVKLDLDRGQELALLAAKEYANIKQIKTVEQLAPRKPFHYVGCYNCPAREFCHPADVDAQELPQGAITDKMMELVELEADLKEMEKRKDFLRDELKDFIEQHPGSYKFKGYTVGYRTQSRESISSDVREILTPEQVEKYVKTSTYKVLTIMKPKELKK